MKYILWNTEERRRTPEYVGYKKQAPDVSEACFELLCRFFSAPVSGTLI